MAKEEEGGTEKAEEGEAWEVGTEGEEDLKG